MDFSFAELQKLADAQYTIEDTRHDLNELVQFFKSKPYWEEAVTYMFCNERKLSMQTAIEHDVFWVSDETLLPDLDDKFLNESLGFVRYKEITQLGRLVYPVKDVKGNVMGLTGWDKFEQPKYLDSRNFGYKAKSTTMFGMERLPEYYKLDKPLFVTEGPIDCLYLREKGFQALSTLGSYLNRYSIEILKRFGDKLFMLPDSDEAGNNFIKQIRHSLPKAHILQAKDGKDVDGYRKLEDGKYETAILSDLTSLSLCPFVPVKSFYVRR